MKVQEMENLSICVAFMKSEGIHFENLGAIGLKVAFPSFLHSIIFRYL
jgi:hypothetical protein